MQWLKSGLGARLLAALASILLLGSLVLGWRRCGTSTTLFVVRHADRAGRDDALSAAGLARATALAHVFAKEPLAAVYHSDTRRTRDTAAPLAQALGITPLERPAMALQPLLEELLNEHRGERVLVVAHSNTAVQLVQDAGGPSLPKLAEDEFDDLFVLDICDCFVNRAKLLRLQYGSASP
jgi:broad specificity phosphatase PhoE